MAEGAPLLRVYTLIAYRGFESLLLRQKQSPASPMRGIFFAVERRVRPLAGSTKRECVLDAKGGAQHLLSSFSLIAINPSHSTHQTIADAGDFFCLVRRVRSLAGSTKRECVLDATGGPQD